MTVVVGAPGGLAALAVGPELSAALAAVPLSHVPNDRMLEVLGAQYRQLCHEQARMAAVLAELTRCRGVFTPGEVAREEVPDRYASAETRAALRWTRRSADAEHDLAETVVHGMPLVFGAWLAGEVDRPRVRVFCQYLRGLSPVQVQRMCAVAVPRAPKLTTGQLAVVLRRMVIAVDPGAADRWYRQGIVDRDVTAYPDADGTITVSANGLPADEAEAACARIEGLAAAAQRAGHRGRIGQIRCDLFLGLLDGRFHGMSTAQVIRCLIADYRPTGPGGPTAAEPDGAAPDTPGGPAGDGPGERSGGGGADPVAGPHGHDGGPGDGRGHGGPGHDSPDTDGPDNSAPRPDSPDDGGPDSRGPDDKTGASGSGPSGSGSSMSAGDQRVGIEIRIGLATLLGLDEHPGEIPGLGLLVAPDARLRVAQQARAEWRFAVTTTEGLLMSEGRTRRRPTGMGRDGPPGGIVELHVPAALLHHLTTNPPPSGTDGADGADGAVWAAWAGVVADIAAQHADRERHLTDLDTHPTDRQPGAGLRRHTQIRDRTCTFAGVCRRPAHAADIDHTQDHAAGGTTERINLGPLCDHDHDIKHRAGWTVTQPEPGTFSWQSPLGGPYPARGEFLTPQLPEPAPTDPEPGPVQPHRHVDGPILTRPPPPPPDPPTPPVQYPDEPPF